MEHASKYRVPEVARDLDPSKGKTLAGSVTSYLMAKSLKSDSSIIDKRMQDPQRTLQALGDEDPLGYGAAYSQTQPQLILAAPEPESDEEDQQAKRAREVLAKLTNERMK